MPSRGAFVRRGAGAAALLAGLLAASPAATAFDDTDPRSEVPLAELLEIVVLPRTLLAIDATSGGETEQALEIGESVLWPATRGRVGAVITNRRLLLVATSSAAWQQARFRQGERPPESVLLGVAGRPNPGPSPRGASPGMGCQSRR